MKTEEFDIELYRFLDFFRTFAPKKSQKNVVFSPIHSYHRPYDDFLRGAAHCALRAYRDE